jgi:hypothetical protein
LTTVAASLLWIWRLRSREKAFGTAG